jgi:hypothetical protein
VTQLPAGWEIKTARFDCGTKWGVAIQRIEGGVCRRSASRAPGELTEQDAINYALPALKAWAGIKD